MITERITFTGCFNSNYCSSVYEALVIDDEDDVTNYLDFKVGCHDYCDIACVLSDTPIEHLPIVLLSLKDGESVTLEFNINMNCSKDYWTGYDECDPFIESTRLIGLA